MATGGKNEDANRMQRLRVLGEEHFSGCSSVQQLWLLEYLEGSFGVACEKVKVNPIQVHHWLGDEVFGEAYDRARECLGMMLESDAMSKARNEEGTAGLMAELLRGLMPHVYDPKARDAEQDMEEGDIAFTQKEIEVDPVD